MNNYLVEAKNIHKVFYNNNSNVYALNGVSIGVKSGETLGILGISGSGKSTLLHILGTLERPTSGEVFFDGADLFRNNDNQLSYIRNKRLGFVFQFHYLLPEFDSLENVMLPCLIQGIDKNTAREKSEMILEKVGLKDRIYHKPGQLSGGEQQRVAIARAVVLRPKVILADEPTGNLDLKTGSSILELFLKLNEEDGITSIIVTHNHEIARNLQNTITLSDGTIVNVN